MGEIVIISIAFLLSFAINNILIFFLVKQFISFSKSEDDNLESLEILEERINEIEQTISQNGEDK